jgi:hypothetical protein
MISWALEIIGASGAVAAVVGLLMVGVGKLAARERVSLPDARPTLPATPRATAEQRTAKLAALAPPPSLSRADEEWLAELHVFTESGQETLAHFQRRTERILSEFLGEPYAVADSFEALHDMFDGPPTESFQVVTI